MRLKSEIWLKAYIRRLAGEGVHAVVARRGDPDAGVILIKISRLDGTARLFGPAPAGLDGLDVDRRWMPIGSKEDDASVDAVIATEVRLDPDLWVIEVEDRAGRDFLDGWLA